MKNHPSRNPRSHQDKVPNDSQTGEYAEKENIFNVKIHNAQTKYEYFEYIKNTKFFGHITTNKWTQIVGSSLDK